MITYSAVTCKTLLSSATCLTTAYKLCFLTNYWNSCGKAKMLLFLAAAKTIPEEVDLETELSVTGIRENLKCS